jgi:hypothetical protein
MINLVQVNDSSDLAPSRSSTPTLVSVARLVRRSSRGREIRRRGPNELGFWRSYLDSSFRWPPPGMDLCAEREELEPHWWWVRERSSLGLDIRHGSHGLTGLRADKRNTPPAGCAMREEVGAIEALGSGWRACVGCHRKVARWRCIHPLVGACTGEGVHDGTDQSSRSHSVAVISSLKISHGREGNWVREKENGGVRVPLGARVILFIRERHWAIHHGLMTGVDRTLMPCWAALLDQ